jgi:hypothetical protein
MIGYCGLGCVECKAFIATKNDDNTLRAKVAEEWAKLNNAPIKPEHINCPIANRSVLGRTPPLHQTASCS